MKRTRYPRVAIGNGSYCYAGPNCKLHGNKSVVSSAKNEITTVEEWSEEGFQQKLDKVATAYQNAVSMSKFVKSLADLKDVEKFNNYCARKIEDGTGYFVYKTSDELPRLGIGVVLDEINKAVDSGVIAKDQVYGLRNSLFTFVASELQTQRDKDKQTMGDLKNAYNRHGPSDKPFTTKNNTRKKTPKTRYPSENLSKQQLLEYHQCYRKRAFSSEAEAKQFVQNEGESPGLNVYNCDYCTKVHIGHGGQKKPEYQQLKSAKWHWDNNPDKADVYAFAKKLID